MLYILYCMQFVRTVLSTEDRGARRPPPPEPLYLFIFVSKNPSPCDCTEIRTHVPTSGGFEVTN